MSIFCNKKELKAIKNLEWSSKAFMLNGMRYLLLFLCVSMLDVLAYRYQCLSHTPRVGIYHDLISQEEARHLINLAQSRMAPSSVVDMKGANSVYTTARTSCSAFLDQSEDAVVSAIEARIAGILACDSSQIEPLQVVRYQLEQEYKPHHDYFSEDQLEGQGSNQRKHTFLIYLNAVPLEAGGSTVFPQLFIACLPSLGAALYFENMNDVGQMQEKTLHGGAPILVQGVEKWACNVWVRERAWQSSKAETLVSVEAPQSSTYPLPAKIPHL